MLLSESVKDAFKSVVHKEAASRKILIMLIL